jgi:plastocyanin
MRLVRPVSLFLASVALLAACSTPPPGWTYAPAPSATPAASGAASAGPSGSASASGSAAPSGSAAASSGTSLVVISALGIKYEQSSVTAPAGKPFQIQFDNKDAGTPHNVTIHQGDAGGAELFKGEIFNGVATRVYDIPALDAGAYAYVCTVHPTMIGTLTVQ